MTVGRLCQTPMVVGVSQKCPTNAQAASLPQVQ